MGRRLEVTILEPYYGGSHASFVDTLSEFSRHNCRLATLPARKWKWRMRGAAIWFGREDVAWMDGRGGKPDVLLCNDMLSAADLRALLPGSLRNVPIVCYFHENQLTYPLPDENERDFQYGMTNITSCLASDAVWFNSRFHLEDFLAAAEKLLEKMPDHVPNSVMQAIRDKASVFPPPVAANVVDRAVKRPGKPLSILWCHRWEYDKNPEAFFDVLLKLDEAGCAFELVILGEQFRTAPPVFGESWDRLKPHIRHTGFIRDRAEYLATLAECELVVSTAIQENFGIAVVEAVLAGCEPLLPNRLAYPEVIPPEFHDKCLYAVDGDLFICLKRRLDGDAGLSTGEMTALMASLEARFGASSSVKAIDDELERIACDADCGL